MNAADCWLYRFSDGTEHERLLDALVYLKTNRRLGVLLVSPDGEEEDAKEKLVLILEDHPYGTGR
jgi:hypothetical protein